MRKNWKRLGEMLLEDEIITDDQLATALSQQKEWGKGKLGGELVRLGFITEEDLAFVLERQLDIQWLSLRDIPVEREVLGIVKKDIALKYLIMPVAFRDRSLVIATMNPLDLQMLDTISFIVGQRLTPVIATESDIRWAIAAYYADSPDADRQRQDTSAAAETAAPQEGRGRDPHAPVSRMEFEALVTLLHEKGVIYRVDLEKKINDQNK